MKSALSFVSNPTLIHLAQTQYLALEAQIKSDAKKRQVNLDFFHRKIIQKLQRSVKEAVLPNSVRTKHIKNLHQSVIMHCADWAKPAHFDSVDLASAEKQILVKFCRSKASSQETLKAHCELYDLTQDENSVFYGWTAYFVPLSLPDLEKRYNEPIKGLLHERPFSDCIRTCDLASMYHLVTGELHALEDLIGALAKCLDICTGEPLDPKESLIFADIFLDLEEKSAEHSEIAQG